MPTKPLYSALCTYLLVVCFLLLGIKSFSQNDPLYRPNWAIKINPLAIGAYTPGIELGIEHFINERSSIHIGGSYLDDFGFTESKNFNGYKLIGEYRLYNLFKSMSINSYGAFQFNYKRTFAAGRTYLDRANGSYQELTDISVTNTSLDFLFAAGNVIPLNEWLSLDLSLVLGIRRFNLASDDFPPDAIIGLFEEAIFDFRINEIGTQWFPVYRMQVKVNFTLNP